jgi:hypothetical protein
VAITAAHAAKHTNGGDMNVGKLAVSGIIAVGKKDVMAIMPIRDTRGGISATAKEG